VTPGEPATYGLIGALAAFPRRLAARAAEEAGARLRRGTARQTTHAVFGRGLLLRRKDAAIAARAAKERAAGRVLLSENGFLRRLGLLPEAEGGTIARGSLIEQAPLAAEDLDMLALFDAFERDAEPFTFRDLILARKYAGLIAAGAGWGDIARAIRRTGAVASLTARSLEAEAGAVYARDGERLSELDGQLLLAIEPPDADPDELFAAAEEAEADERHAEAAALYARCLALDPRDASAAFNRANCLRAIDRLADAECEYARALQLDPGFVEAWFNLAAVAADRGRPDAARRCLEQAVARDPDYADAVFNLAALAFEAGDLHAAARWWTRYLELDPDSEWGRRAVQGLRYIAFASREAGHG
jgi:tetratricopeptide (TPR) repeat protein